MSEETVFHEALAKPAAERSAFLDQACAGQPQLRVAVEALLAAHEASGDLLDRPAAAPLVKGEFTPEPDDRPPGADAARLAGTADYHPDAEAGAIIAGRYTLVEKIGEGGMGEVWVAKQTEPVKRRVALKLIKAGMDSRAVLTRFEHERQALALMDHPNIAKVLDGGLTADRRPFFVMELVNGLPLTKFCDEAKLGIRERLDLFVSICQAVQHAHQKGIVHRDLKPSNIMVTLLDGQPIPKVIDFGVAKAIGGKLTDESLSTQFGAVIGTLEYMSPEQAGFSAADVDTRADIYSLGVILYELLTGLRPFDGQRLRKAALDEMIRIIREEEPSKPSTRLSTDEASPSLAALRQTEPGRLAKLLRGELDWVVMKCLEKQRDRRYETANALSRDVQRYLADEAVEARPPSAGYRLSKFLKRNKGPAVAAAALLLSLIGGIIGTTWGLLRAERAREAETQRAAAEAKERQRAEAAERLAEQNFQKARQAIDDYFTKVSESTLLSVPGLQPLRRELLELALNYYKGFLRQRGADASVRADFGAASYRVATITWLLGTAEQARPAMEEARAVYLALTREQPSVTRYWVDLAMCDNDLGRLFRAANDRKTASRYHREALEIRERNAREHPDQPRFQDELVRSYANLAILAYEESRNDEALQLTQQGIEILERVTRDAPLTAVIDLPTDLGQAFNSIAALRSAVSGHYIRLGNIYTRAGRKEDARDAYLKSFAIVEALLTANPKSVIEQSAYASTGTGVSESLLNLGHPVEANTVIRKVKPVVEKLVAENPNVAWYRTYLSNLLYSQGELASETGQGDEAKRALKECLTVLEARAAEEPNSMYYQGRIARVCRHIALLPSPHVSPAESIEFLRRAESVLRHIPNPLPAWIYELACVQALLAARLESATERDRYQQRAMDTLRRAVDAGYKSVAIIRSNRELQALQGRDDFKKLLAELEKQQVATPEKQP